MREGNLSLDHFRAGVTKVGEVDGKQLGIPVGSNTMALVIDKKLFQQAGVEPAQGWTWDEYFKALKTIHELTDAAGKEFPVQSWPLAHWPDGSLKWRRTRWVRAPAG